MGKAGQWRRDGSPEAGRPAWRSVAWAAILRRHSQRVGALKPRALLLAVMVLGAFGWVGCAGLMSSIQSPQVNIVNLRVDAVQALETTFTVDLRVINPNDFALDVRGVTCKLELNDQNVGSGVSAQSVSVPALGTEVVQLTVYSSMINLFRGILRLSERETLTYRISGAVKLNASGLRIGSLPFESKGEIALSSSDIK